MEKQNTNGIRKKSIHSVLRDFNRLIKIPFIIIFLSIFNLGILLSCNGRGNVNNVVNYDEVKHDEYKRIRNTPELIDQSLGKYYQDKRKVGYFDKNGKGKFLTFCEENDLLDDFKREIKSDFDHNIFLDFDENFPVPEDITDHTEKEKYIHRIIMNICNNDDGSYDEIGSIDTSLGNYCFYHNKENYQKGTFKNFITKNRYSLNSFYNELKDDPKNCEFLSTNFKETEINEMAECLKLIIDYHIHKKKSNSPKWLTNSDQIDSYNIFDQDMYKACFNENVSRYGLTLLNEQALKILRYSKLNFTIDNLRKIHKLIMFDQTLGEYYQKFDYNDYFGDNENHGKYLFAIIKDIKQSSNRQERLNNLYEDKFYIDFPSFPYLLYNYPNNNRIGALIEVGNYIFTHKRLDLKFDEKHGCYDKVIWQVQDFESYTSSKNSYKNLNESKEIEKMYTRCNAKTNKYRIFDRDSNEARYQNLEYKSDKYTIDYNNFVQKNKSTSIVKTLRRVYLDKILNKTNCNELDYPVCSRCERFFDPNGYVRFNCINNCCNYDLFCKRCTSYFHSNVCFCGKKLNKIGHIAKIFTPIIQEYFDDNFNEVIDVLEQFEEEKCHNIYKFVLEECENKKIIAPPKELLNKFNIEPIQQTEDTLEKYFINLSKSYIKEIISFLEKEYHTEWGSDVNKFHNIINNTTINVPEKLSHKLFLEGIVYNFSEVKKAIDNRYRTMNIEIPPIDFLKEQLILFLTEKFKSNNCNITSYYKRKQFHIEFNEFIEIADKNCKVSLGMNYGIYRSLVELNFLMNHLDPMKKSLLI
ncbi:MAG: hypothetical protein GY830_02895 [Bacteroidetes bacterium]|nr:hypothetical protein [Bacteroidota bacterium]